MGVPRMLVVQSLRSIVFFLPLLVVVSKLWTASPIVSLKSRHQTPGLRVSGDSPFSVKATPNKTVVPSQVAPSDVQDEKVSSNDKVAETKPCMDRKRGLPWKWRVTMTRDFKWGFGPQPQWTSVCGGRSSSGDVCKGSGRTLFVHLDGDISFLNKLEIDEFDRVQFVGLNVNELSKLTWIIEYILHTDYSEFDGFACLRDRIASDLESFYLPGYLAGIATFSNGLQFRACTDMFWKPKSQTTYQHVQAQLRDKVSPFYDFKCRAVDPKPAPALQKPSFDPPLQPLPFRWTVNSTLPLTPGTSSPTPVWGAVFLLSNDEIDGIPELGKCMSQVEVRLRNLVTVVGGMKFLVLLEHVEWNLITFFDLNVNEVSKLSLAIQYIISTPYEKYDGFRSINEGIIKNASNFFLPVALNGKAAMWPASDFTFPYHGKIEPLWSILPPASYPEYIWKPKSKTTYERVQYLLRNRIDPVFQLGFADVHVADNSVVAYFSSHVPHGVNQLVHGKNVMVLPLWSSLDGAFKGQNVQQMGDAHAWWQYKVSSLLRGTSLHVWSVYDKSLLNGPYQTPYFTAGDVADKFIQRDIREMKHYGTTVLHIFLAKPTTNCEHHKDTLLKAVSLSCRISDRVIIADGNKDSEVFIDSPCLPSLADLRTTLSSTLQRHNFSISVESFACGDSRFGGDKKKGIVAQRNVLFVADKISGNGS